jgi:hypothetical protein
MVIELPEPTITWDKKYCECSPYPQPIEAPTSGLATGSTKSSLLLGQEVAVQWIDPVRMRPRPPATASSRAMLGVLCRKFPCRKLAAVLN